MRQVFDRPEALRDVDMAYCSGCSHGIVHRLIAEVIDELQILDRTVGVCPVGCSVFMYEYMACDSIEAAHGRAPAVATGVKRVLPDRVVFTYQGDGDLAAIGTAEIVHAAARGENISVVFINNTTYGMTGGQMAPTTMPGQETTTTPGGRDTARAGFPLRVCEVLARLWKARHTLQERPRSAPRVLPEPSVRSRRRSRPRWTGKGSRWSRCSRIARRSGV